MIKRYDVTGAGGLRLVAWEYASPDAAVRRQWRHRDRAETGPAVADATAATAVASAAAAEADRRAGAGGPEVRADAVLQAKDRRAGAGGPERPAVLMLHGLLGRASHWAPTARRLSPRYRVLALDQRGHGHSAKPEGPYTPEVYALDVLAAIEQLGLAPVVLVGHAMGALTAWQCAARRPDLVAAVVLCDMRAAALGEAGQRAWAEWLRTWPLPFATLADVRRWFAAEDAWADPPSPARGEFFAEVMAEGEDGWRPLHTPEHVLRSREQWIRDAHWDELAAVACPALVVRGPGGELGRAEAQEMVRVLPRGRYAEIADAGHLAPWEQPDAWNAVVEGFIGEALAEQRSAACGGAA